MHYLKSWKMFYVIVFGQFYSVGNVYHPLFKQSC